MSSCLWPTFATKAPFVLRWSFGSIWSTVWSKRLTKLILNFNLFSCQKSIWWFPLPKNICVVYKRVVQSYDKIHSVSYLYQFSWRVLWMTSKQIDVRKLIYSVILNICGCMRNIFPTMRKWCSKSYNQELKNNIRLYNING